MIQSTERFAVAITPKMIHLMSVCSWKMIQLLIMSEIHAHIIDANWKFGFTALGHAVSAPFDLDALPRSRYMDIIPTTGRKSQSVRLDAAFQPTQLRSNATFVSLSATRPQCSSVGLSLFINSNEKFTLTFGHVQHRNQKITKQI